MIAGILVLPVFWHLLLTPQVIERIIAFVGEQNFRVVGVFIYTPVWAILAIQGWLVLLGYFSVPYICSYWPTLTNHCQRIQQYSVIALLLIGLVTWLIGFEGLIQLVTTNEDWAREILDFSSIELSPATGFLTIGLWIMIYVSLGKALLIEGNKGQPRIVARNMVIALILTLIILGVGGGFLVSVIHDEREMAFPNLK